MLRLLPLVFLIGVSYGLKYIEERDVKTSSGKVFTCFYTIQYNAKGVVSTKKSSVSCTPAENGGSAMPVFDLPGVGPTAIKHNIKKGKCSVQEYSAHSAPVKPEMPMNCSCKLPQSLMDEPKPDNDKPEEKPELMQKIDEMCADGGKPEMLKEVMEMMGGNKEQIMQHMMEMMGGDKEQMMEMMGGDKEQMMQQMMEMMGSSHGGMGGHGSHKPNKLDMLQQFLGKPKPMGGMGGMGGNPMGGMGGMGGHGHLMGGKPVGGKPMGSGDCKKKLMAMICSKVSAMKPPGKPECMSCAKMEEKVMKMLEGKMGNLNCECTTMQ